MKSRFTAVMVLAFLFCAALVARAVHIQLGADKRLASMAKRQFQSRVLVRPRRGMILDRNGEPLAVNSETRSLAANPSKIQNKQTLARLLAKALDLPPAKVLDRLKEKKEFVWIRRHLTDAAFDRLRKWQVIDAGGDLADGLWLVKESQRIYPHGELAAHVLGDVNLDSEGMEGVELWANKQLQGKVIAVSAVRDALGRPTFLDAVAARDVKDGDPVQLTLDASLQFSVEQELRNSVVKHGARSGTVIVMNAGTGEILAMANEPSYNPNQKGADPSHRRNRALTDGYEPGSTMKTVLLAGALANGFKLTDQLHGEGGSFYVQGKKISEAEAHEKFTWMSLKKMIQVSSNVGAAKLALKLGADRYFQTLKDFGFGVKTGSGFPGEIAGKVPARKDWQSLTTANIGFGQGLLVTPMQMLRAYATFLNGGFLVQPSLVMKTPEAAPPEAPKRVIPQKVADGVVEALHSVTEKPGTGLKAVLEGYEVAGKTGTAQAVDPRTRKYSRSRYVASFIGFPMGVEPRIAVLTLIDEPRGVYYASETAAPLFRSVLSAVANRFSLPPKNLADVHTDEHQPLIARVPMAKPSKAAVLQDQLQYSLAKVTEPVDRKPEWEGLSPQGEMVWKMPLLTGLTSREAMEALQVSGAAKFQVEIQGSGIVRSQSPDPGATLSSNGTIKLLLGEP